ncbi:MAG TPA: thioredoxin family protein [Bacteroidetes bacterium]|nr:thioredoxin family protein [Bacteroidota bacterium]
MKKLSALLAILTSAALFVACTGNQTSTASGTQSKAVPDVNRNAVGLAVGDTAPDFELMNVDSTLISLSHITTPDGSQPKGHIVTFTCNTCPFAVMYEDRLIALHNEYAPKGWPVVAINPNDPDVKPGDSFAKMQERAHQKNFPFVYLFDENQEVYPQYGATRTPHIFLLDSLRTVRYIGAIDNNPEDASAVTQHYLRNAIAALEAGQKPDPDFTKAIGCTIKKKK